MVKVNHKRSASSSSPPQDSLGLSTKLNNHNETDSKSSAVSANANPTKPKPKKRRSRKGLEKSFICNEPGCDKKFTRLEHLSRHQLNHKPKEIYSCSWEGCTRTFVREDLKIRHVDRHIRRNGLINHTLSNKSRSNTPPSLNAAFNASNSDISASKLDLKHESLSQKVHRDPLVNSLSQHELQSSHLNGFADSLRALHHGEAYEEGEDDGFGDSSTFSNNRYPHSTSTTINNLDVAADSAVNMLSPLTSSKYTPHINSSVPSLRTTGRPYQLLDNLNGINSLDNITHTRPITSNTKDTLYNSASPESFAHLSNNQSPSAFGNSPQSALHKPLAVADTKINIQHGNRQHSSSHSYSPSQPNQQSSRVSQGTPDFIPDPFGFDPLYTMNPGMLFMDPNYSMNNSSTPNKPPNQNPELGPSMAITDTNDLIAWLFSDAMMQSARDPVLSPSCKSWDSPMALQNLLTSPTNSRLSEIMALSESKRYKLLQLIPEVTNSLESGSHSRVNKFEKNTSLESLQRYIARFWLFFHPQYPILHKPTFSPDRCPEGLLWVIIVIGASYDRCDDFSRAVADPLRWVLFGSPEFDPPAKLWVIQSLILLEFYEKVMTSRRLHIRGHIHHGSTLQLIRRGPMLSGSSISGKGVAVTAEAALLSVFENNQIGEGMDGSSSNVMMQACKPDNDFDNDSDYEQEIVSYKDPWKRWIQFEETKRAALLAFIMDVNHATMFSHVALIGVHELRVSLPCREDLWESSNPDEVVGQSFLKNGTIFGGRDSNPSSGISFLEALKLTLNGKPVQTESFGRKAILSGLMSIQYNMQQRDLQITSIGWGTFKGTWRDIMRSAYMFWRRDYKKNLKTAEQNLTKKQEESAKARTGVSSQSPLGNLHSVSVNSNLASIDQARGGMGDVHRDTVAGTCSLCDKEAEQFKDDTTSNKTNNTHIIAASLKDDNAIDTLIEIYDYQFKNHTVPIPEDEMYTCVHGNLCFRKLPKTPSSSHVKNGSSNVPIEELIANPPKFVLEINGCADPLLHMSMIDMSIAQYDLQYYCGIISIFNTSVKRADYHAAKKRVIEWVKSPQGTESLHFAVHFLKEMYLCGDNSSVDMDKEIDVCPNTFLEYKRKCGTNDGPSSSTKNKTHVYSTMENESNSSKRRKGNDGSYYAQEPKLDEDQQTSSKPTYPNNPYLAIYDPIPHRPYIVFICAMLIWTYGHVIGGPEDPNLWTPPPPLPNFLFNRKNHDGNGHDRDDHDDNQEKYHVDKFGNMNDYPMGGYNGSQRVTPAILGRHVFKHMRTLPHKQNGLEYLERLSQETSKAMASRTCVGIRGAGTSNIPLEANNDDVSFKKRTSHDKVSKNSNANGSSTSLGAVQNRLLDTNQDSSSSSRAGSATIADGLSTACNNNARFYDASSTTAATEYSEKATNSNNNTSSTSNKSQSGNGSTDTFPHIKTENDSSNSRSNNKASNSNSHTDSSTANDTPFQINHSAGLLKLVIESLQNHRWEISAEGKRLLTHCLERSMGRKEVKCHYLRWEC